MSPCWSQDARKTLNIFLRPKSRVQFGLNAQKHPTQIRNDQISGEKQITETLKKIPFLGLLSRVNTTRAQTKSGLPRQKLLTVGRATDVLDLLLEQTFYASQTRKM